MENPVNLDTTSQQKNKDNNRLIYIIGILVILGFISVGLYFFKQDYFKAANKPLVDNGQQVTNDGLEQYFINEDKKLAPDVLPPEEIKQRFEKDIVTSEEYIKTEEAKEDGNPYQGYLSLANDYRSLGQYQTAEDAYNRMIDKYPDDWLVYHNLGVLYEDMHQYLSAARAYATSIAKKPIEIIAHTKLASLSLNHSSEPAKVKEVYLKALQDTENNIEIVKAYASYLETVEKNLSQALLYWQEALKQSPDNQAIKDRVEELKGKIQ